MVEVYLWPCPSGQHVMVEVYLWPCPSGQHVMVEVDKHVIRVSMVSLHRTESTSWTHYVSTHIVYTLLLRSKEVVPLIYCTQVVHSCTFHVLYIGGCASHKLYTGGTQLYVSCIVQRLCLS